jgi:hypothetical protein
MMKLNDRSFFFNELEKENYNIVNKLISPTSNIIVSSGLKSGVSSYTLFSFLSRLNGDKNVIFIPSGAGIFTYFSDTRKTTKDIFRLEAYTNICHDLSRHFNIHLVSLSGQAGSLNPKSDKFSFSFKQSIIDIKLAIKHIEIIYGKLNGGIGFCTGAAGLAKALIEAKNDNIPLVCWDVPAENNWKLNYKSFSKLFPIILINTKTIIHGMDPIDIIPNYKGNILFLYSKNNSQYKENSFIKLISKLGRNNKSFKSKFIIDLGHLPMKKQNKQSYLYFLKEIVDWCNSII